MGQRRHKQRRQRAAATERQAAAPEVNARDRPFRRFYWMMGAVGLAGGAMLAAALAPSGRRAVSPTATPAPSASSFPTEYDSLGITLGPDDAPVTVREFVDYQCPACRQFAPTMQRLRDEFVSSGELRVVFFDLPITSMHPNALVAAQAARCSGRQSNYWAMHDALFAHQSEWAEMTAPATAFARYARDADLDVGAFNDCLTTGATLHEVRRSAEFAAAIGVRSTPTVVVGNVRLPGGRSYAELRSLIDAQLGGRVSADARPPPAAIPIDSSRRDGGR